MVAPYTVVPNRRMRSMLQVSQLRPYTVRPLRVGGPEWDTQRFYFAFSTAAPVNVAYDAAWSVTSAAVRRLLTPAIIGDSPLPIIIGVADGWTTGTCLFRQLVSPPLRSGVIFNGARTRLVQQSWEANVADNLFTRTGLRVASEDGGTIRATLLPVADYRGTEIDTPVTSRIWLNNEAVASYTTQAGDRLVLELGYAAVSGDSTPNGRMTHGTGSVASQPDYGFADFEDTLRNPWIDIVPEGAA